MHVGLLLDTDARVAEGAALGDQDLRTHQIHAGDHLRHRVLHLNAGIHLDEVVMALAVHQKFQRSGVGVAHLFGDLHRVLIQLLADLLGHGERRGELHHLLIPPLERAVPLVEMDHVAVLVGKDLHLDVLRFHEELLHEDVVVSKGLFRLGLHQIVVDADLLHGVAPAHTAPAAAGRRLQDHGEAEVHGQLLGGLTVGDGVLGAGGCGNAALDGQRLGAELVAHPVQHVAAGADELDPRRLAGAGKVAVLAQKAVSGVDGIRAVFLRQLDDPRDVQIRAQRAFILADQIGFVRRRAEQSVHILVGIDGDGLHAQIVARAEHTHGDLAAVRHQHLFELFAHGLPPFTCLSGKANCLSIGARSRAASSPPVYRGGRLRRNQNPRIRENAAALAQFLRLPPSVFTTASARRYFPERRALVCGRGVLPCFYFVDLLSTSSRSLAVKSSKLITPRSPSAR